MIYTSLKFESEEAARSQVEPLQIQPRLILGHDGRRWLRSKTLQKQFFLWNGWQSLKPCTRQRVALANPSANKRVKQSRLRPMVFRQLATDARAPVTNSKHCGSDAMHLISCCTSCLLLFFWTIAAAPPVLVVMSVHAEVLTHTFDRHCYNFHTLVSILVGFVEVQPGFLQLFLNQTWVKCTSLDSSRCVVYFGIRFHSIWAASKKLEQYKW